MKVIEFLGARYLVYEDEKGKSHGVVFFDNHDPQVIIGEVEEIVKIKKRIEERGK